MLFAEQDAVGAHRPRDVLDLLLAHVLEGEVELVAHLVAHDPADADPAGLGQGFESSRDIDAVDKDVALVHDNVAEIDPDAEYDPLILWRRCVPRGHSTLHRDRAGDGLNDAWELDQDAVAGGFDDAAFVFGDARIDQFAAMRFEARQGASLVLAHEPRVAGHIGGENGCEPALDPLSTQNFLPRSDLRKVVHG